MAQATMTSKGQITVPASIRKALRLDTGDRVAFQLREDGVVEMSPENVDLMTLRGMVKPRRRGVTVAAMRRVIARRGAGR
jgi:AbrB family looped-hinge helix DNA binding protein